MFFPPFFNNGARETVGRSESYHTTFDVDRVRVVSEPTSTRFSRAGTVYTSAGTAARARRPIRRRPDVVTSLFSHLARACPRRDPIDFENAIKRKSRRSRLFLRTRRVYLRARSCASRESQIRRRGLARRIANSCRTRRGETLRRRRRSLGRACRVSSGEIAVTSRRPAFISRRDVRRENQPVYDGRRGSGADESERDGTGREGREVGRGGKSAREAEKRRPGPARDHSHRVTLGVRRFLPEHPPRVVWRPECRRRRRGNRERESVFSSSLISIKVRGMTNASVGCGFSIANRETRTPKG